MRAVLVGIDYVKDIDGSFKILEINTNASIPNFNPLLYLNVDEYQQFLTSNNITDVHFIFTQGNLISGVYRDLENELPNPPHFLSVMGMKTTEVSGVTFNPHIIMSNGLIPSIEETENTLIIRQTYDSTALIDYDYARDNFQFLKLMYDHDMNSIPKTYFSHFTMGIDMIDTIRDNGVHPNFIVKKRYPVSGGEDYPKLYRLTTVEELNQLKSSLLPNDILQEYIYNPNDLLNGKLKTYRSIDLFYGQLDVLNLCSPFEQSNPMVLTENTDYTDTLEVQVWDRPKYIQKTVIRSCDRVLKRYKCDDSNVVLKNDGTIVDPNQLSNGNLLMSVNIPDLPLEEGKYMSWTGNTETILSGTTTTGTTIVDIDTQEVYVWIKTITLSDGPIFSDTIDAAAMVDYSGTTKFTKFLHLNVGDNIFVYDNENGIVKNLSIVDVGVSYSKENAYLIDVEPFDVYMVAEEDTISPKVFLIEHNGPCEPYFWYGDLNCSLQGGEWTDDPAFDYFDLYSWFCGDPCGQDMENGGFYSNSCDCRNFFQNGYGFNSTQAAWACRFFCCGVTPENCGALIDANNCTEFFIMDPPCQCQPIDPGNYDCFSSKMGYPDPSVIPVPPPPK